MSKRNELPQSLLHEILSYNAETGELRWKRRPRHMFNTDHEFSRWNTRYSGAAALTARIDGYPMGPIFGKSYKAHRVIFCMIYGYWPEYVDHLNGIRHDNRACNLRAASKVENGKNQKRNTRNKSGVTGVYWYEPSKKWRAQINVDAKKIYLGQFETKEDAISARLYASKKYGFSERHGSL